MVNPRDIAGSAEEEEEARDDFRALRRGLEDNVVAARFVCESFMNVDPYFVPPPPPIPPMHSAPEGPVATAKLYSFTLLELFNPLAFTPVRSRRGFPTRMVYLKHDI